MSSGTPLARPCRGGATPRRSGRLEPGWSSAAALTLPCAAGTLGSGRPDRAIRYSGGVREAGTMFPGIGNPAAKSKTWKFAALKSILLLGRVGKVAVPV